MADREFIEFVLTATDLASRKLNEAAASIERETAKIENAAKGASGEIDKLGTSMERTGPSSTQMRRNMGAVAGDMEKAGREAEKYEQRVRTLPGALERFSTALAGNVRALREHHSAAATLGNDLNGIDRAAANALRGVDKLASGAARLGRGFEELATRSRRARTELDLTGHAVNAVYTGFRLAEDAARGLGRGLGDLANGVGKTGKELDKLAADADRQVTKWERVGSVWGRASSGILSIGVAAARGVIGLGAMGAIIAGLPIIIEGIAGAAEAAAGGVFALGSALSTLSATAVALPAVLTGVVGSIAAITTVLKPAVSGVLAYVAAAGKAQQGLTGSTGGGTAVQTPAQLEKQLHLTRMQNALQEKQAEQQLALLKINTAQTLIQDQKTLDNLRAQDRISEQNAQADLKNAKAKLRQLEQQGAPQAEIKAAQAQVAQAEENLHKTKLQNQQAESQAAAKLQHDKVNGVAQIKAAEIQLQLLQISNAQQVASLQHQIAQGQSGALSRQADLFKHLTPLQQQLATGILNLKKRWDQLTASFKNRFIQQLLIDLKDLNTFLPVIAKTVGGFANTITDTIGAITQQLVSPNGQPTALGSRLGGFVTFIQQQQRLAIGLSTGGQAAGGGLLALGDAITRFVTSPPAEKFIHFLTVSVNQLGTWALNAEKAGEKNGSIARFFEHAREVAKLVGKIAENLGAAVFNIGKIAFPTGAGFLESLKQITGRFRHFTETAKGRNEIKRYFDDARDAIHHAVGALDALIGGLAHLGRTAIAQGGGQGGAPTVRGGRATRGPISARTPSGLDQFFDLIKSAAPVAETFIATFTKTTGPALVSFLKAAGPILVVVAGDMAQLLGVLTSIAQAIDKHPWARDLAGGLIALFVAGPLAVRAVKKVKTGFDEARNAARFLRSAWTKVFADDAGAAGGLTLMNKVKLAVHSTFDRVKELSSGGIARLKDLGQRGFKAAFEHANNLRGKLVDAANVAKDLGKRGFTAAINSAKDLGGKMATVATNMGNFLKSVGTAGLTALRNFAIMVGETVVGALQGMAVALGIATVGEEGFTLALSATGIGAIIVVIGLLIAAIILIATHWSQTKRIVVEGVKEIWHLMQQAWGEIKHLTSEAWNAVKGFIEHHWKDILLFFTGPLGIAGLLSKFVGGPGAIWDKLKSVASTAWSAIKGIITTAWDGIVHFFTNTAPDKISSAFTGIWNAVKSASVAALNGVVDVINFFLDKVASGIDAVASALGFGKPIGLPFKPLGHIGGSATGGGGAPTVHGGIPHAAEGGIFQPVPGGLIRVVEAGQPEAIIPLDPSKRGRALSIMDEVLRRIIPGFAAGGIVQQPGQPPINRDTSGSSLIPGVGALLSEIPGVSSLEKLAGKVGDMAVGVGKWVVTKAKDWVESKAEQYLVNPLVGFFTGGADLNAEARGALQKRLQTDSHWRWQGVSWGNAPQSAALHRYPGGVPPWNRVLAPSALADLGRVVLGAYGKSSSLGAFIGRAMQESGGYSAIVNQWDSNWLAGIPSIGLLQTIGPTFNRYAAGPLKNIWDPLHNAMAAVAYMLQNYHRIVGPSGSGYALGGAIGDHKAGVTAGRREGQPVRILAHVGEWVLNRDQQDKLAHVFGSRDKAFHALFTRPSFGGMFAAGGMVTGLGAAPAMAGGGAAIQVGPIHTTSPQIDIDYVVRAIELRLGRFS